MATMRTLDQVIDSLPNKERTKVITRARKLVIAETNVRLTVMEAAKYVRLSKGTLDNLRTTGGGPRYIKLGRKVIYDRTDLDQWLEDHKQNSTADKPQLRRRRRRRLRPRLDSDASL